MPCLSACLVYVYMQVAMASHVLFADKSSDDRVFDLFGGFAADLSRSWFLTLSRI